jgi:solute carrier family 25 protein 34/35
MGGDGYAVNFAASSIAPSIAAIFTNPIEVCKVRQQMDPKPGGILGTLRSIWSSHGMAGLQAGLQMAIVREASKSFFRIGLFSPILNQLHDKSQGSAPMYKRMAAGMSSGAIAALICNPIELVKTRQQAAASSAQATFHYNGALDGLRKLYASEGLVGMWRGTSVSMLRSAMVTGPHLTTYTGVKELMVERELMSDAPPLHMLASLCGALAGICCNQPLDVVRNRLYNQPLGPSGEGTLYSGAVDCAQSLARSEGLRGFYRGFWSHYIRVGPHYVLTFTFLEQIKVLLGASKK